LRRRQGVGFGSNRAMESGRIGRSHSATSPQPHLSFRGQPSVPRRGCARVMKLSTPNEGWRSAEAPGVQRHPRACKRYTDASVTRLCNACRPGRLRKRPALPQRRDARLSAAPRGDFRLASRSGSGIPPKDVRRVPRSTGRKSAGGRFPNLPGLRYEPQARGTPLPGSASGSSLEDALDEQGRVCSMGTGLKAIP